jgi:hypothetical protein
MNPAAGNLFPGSLTGSILGAAWAWLLALLLGASILRFRTDPEASEGHTAADEAVSRLLAWTVLGIVVESYAWMLLSGLGLINRTAVLAGAAVLSGAGAILGWSPIRDALRKLRGAKLAEPKMHVLQTAAVAVLAIVLLLVIRLALMPSAYYDDLVYHLGLPRQALLTGSWPSLPEFYSAFMPASWEITYLLPLSLGGGSGPQIMNVMALCLTAIAAHRIARLGGGRTVALAVTALLLASPMFVGLGSLASNDLFAGLALVVALDRLCITSGHQPVQVGLLAGAAWAAKYTALPAVVGLGVGAAMLSLGTMGRRLGRMAVVWGVGALVGMVWMVRAFALTGNPVYPAFNEVFGGHPWTAEAASILTRDSSLGA